MADSVLRKLIVGICNANNLMSNDGQGTASAYAIVDYDGQRRRTKIKFRDLNPQRDEKLEFYVHDAATMGEEIFEINLCKVKIAGNAFAAAGSETRSVVCLICLLVFRGWCRRYRSNHGASTLVVSSGSEPSSEEESSDEEQEVPTTKKPVAAAKNVSVKAKAESSSSEEDFSEDLKDQELLV